MATDTTVSDDADMDLFSMTGRLVKRLHSGRKRTSHDVDVVIVGADITGLTAAHAIADSGRTVTVVDAAAQADGVDVRPVMTVRRIEHSRAGVVVHLGYDTSPIRARACIVSAEQGEVVDFVPPLAKRLPVVNIVMTFRLPVDHGPRQLWDVTCNPPLIWLGSAEPAAAGGQIATAWAVGHHASELLALPEPARVERALASLRTMTGNTHAMYTHAQTHTWAGDNDVLFLSQRQSCVDTAYERGLKVADDVLRSLL